MAFAVTVEFSDHASNDRKRLVISSLNAVSGAVEVIGKPAYTFVISRQSKIARTREALSEWEMEGLVRWSQTEFD